MQLNHSWKKKGYYINPQFMSSDRRKRENHSWTAWALHIPSYFEHRGEISPAKLEDQSGEIPPNLLTLGWLSPSLLRCVVTSSGECIKVRLE